MDPNRMVSNRSTWFHVRMSKTRRVAGIVMLILALAFAASVPAIRRNDVDEIYRLAKIRGEYASLYYSRFTVVDAQTSEPLDAKLSWDGVALSPWTKDMVSASVVETRPDRSLTLIAVGKRLPDGLRVTVRLPGYRSEDRFIQSRAAGLEDYEESNVPTIGVRLIRE
ncbi:MAG: hypothetical protein JWO82_4435 [Akkermansiaceae bacterium]|nr:hypothetical protein [Akkermansiaceae bacterium]